MGLIAYGCFWLSCFCGDVVCRGCVGKEDRCLGSVGCGRGFSRVVV